MTSRRDYYTVCLHALDRVRYAMPEGLAWEVQAIGESLHERWLDGYNHGTIDRARLWRDL